MLTLLQNKEIETDELRIYLRAFKKEKQLELWGKNSTDKTYQLIKTYDVCQSSGDLGPKREQGDYQVPEGFYHIDRFNPYSNFHLSLGLNYPNKSDKILGVKNNLGGDIFIHGACVTIGCLPITDEQIKELYIFCIEAKEHGQSKISITIFPSKLSKAEFSRLSLKYKTDSDKIELWKELKSGYDIFNQTHQLPTIGFLSSGRHLVN
ncbi:L,D-transpeptidase family protein [Sediminitomix flava]|uniref:L,D-transpeptidase-like protein n=1 Tax=Sediminitomix flava TaxID=379075 RepID=A0A315ZGV1_SEDFL|nr:L,D-transpeptidase family protein [Sediminitomix flava]PWJ44741.1 L,D-transpeptidase-like protein [Sediminitomix flava]